MDVMQAFNLSGKIAVVTGGAGLYGRQVTEALAEAGATAVIASRGIEKIQALADRLCDQGYRVVAMPYDQADMASIRRLRDQVVERYGRVEALVNNAVLRPMQTWSDPIEQFERSMAVNAVGVFEMTRVFGDHMAEAGGGSIVNIGSIHGMIGPDFTLYRDLEWNAPPDYFYNKGGMAQLTRYAAAKLGPSGVRVNTISPGGFFSQQDPRFVERYEQRTFLGRMANERDIKGAVVFLASEASAYMTGANLPVDGGYTAK